MRAPADPQRGAPARHALPASRALALYGAVTRALAPLAPALLARRAHRSKEDRDRLAERLGRPGTPRPDGQLLWLHAASVGESLSVLPLIARLRAAYPQARLLVTTGTVTSARLMAERLPEGATHQFAPVDTPQAVAGFLDHWRPDAGIFVESELWPNLILAARARGVALALVNARLSAASARGWRRWPGAARALAGAFEVVLAQDEGSAQRLRELGAQDARHAGNLKVDAPPPPASDALLAELAGLLSARPAWIAASTHPGEERFIAEAHARLKALQPDLLTVIVPRHPERGADIRRMLEAQQLSVARRSTGDAVTAATDIYLADTLGELGGFFRLLTITFMGGSLVRAGGHNPIEPALLGAALLAGPHVHNFRDIYQRFEAAGACETVTDAATLAAAVARLMRDGALAGARVQAAAETAGALTGALEITLAALRPMLEDRLTAETAR